MTDVTPDYANYDAEDVLRDLCMFMGIGGYNDVGLREFDVKLYMDKIKDEINELQVFKMRYFNK